jgi:DNA-binding response OmpR family regulator
MDTFQGKKVVLLDNESKVTELMQAKLESAGFSVIIANNGQDGLKLIEGEKPDLIIMDVLLPGLTGYAILDILKVKNSKIPVLIISSVSDIADILSVQNIAGLLIKPVDLEKMLIHIDSIFKLQRAAEAIPDSIEKVWEAEDRSFDDSSLQKTSSVEKSNGEDSISNGLGSSGEISKPLVLVIDDEDDLRTLLTDLLEGNGFRVVSAKDGVEGLNLARQIMPNAILLDIMLPVMDGFQVCRLLKFNEKYRDIPIIMLTARQSNADGELANAAGANSFIHKPFDTSHVIEELNRLILKKKTKPN